MDIKNPLIRPPVADDGYPIYTLIKNSPPLDLNSAYLYLLQSTYFSQTCAVAEVNEAVAGFLSGFIKPTAPDTFFLWQVAVGENLRGQGMARKLLNWILEQPACREVRYLETTITPDNAASWALFQAFARDRQAPLNDEVLFSKQQLGGSHEPEVLVRIGPFNVG